MPTTRSVAHTLGLLVLVGSATAGRIDAQQLTDKLTVHGYLTQGYAMSDSSLVMGIPKRGTSDYRRAALLFRYDGSEHDDFVVQIANRRLGDSPTMTMEPDVKLDWAFYEHRFGENTFARIGKVPLPQGIFNETRYVGVTQPFYRVPFAFYSEGQYTSETIDGIVAEQKLFTASPLPLTISEFGGGYSYLEFGTVFNGRTSSYVGSRVQVQNVLGTQVWLQTPLEGLRVGGGALRSTNTGGLYLLDGAQNTAVTKTASIDGVFEHFTARGEWMWIRSGDVFTMQQGYAQLGVNATQRLSINVQVESSDMSIVAFNKWNNVKLTRDQSLGTAYKLSPGLVLKVEGHITNGHNFEQVDNTFGPAHKGKYFITSMSAAF